MGKFLTAERRRQAEVKQTSDFFSPSAKPDGLYRKLPRAYCFPLDFAQENLFDEIREGAIDYFYRNDIGWHNGTRQRPSNHMCSSQVCCVNFLYPFMDKPEALKALLKPIYPDIHSILSMENDGDYVTFEWIGHENYLQEKMRGQIRTRGANFTSADAAVMVENNDGSRQIILIEWKYTESYSSQSKTVAKSGTDRVAIYQHLYDKDDFPLDKSRLPSFDSLFYEPFYQFFRQQALASEMERAGELNTDRVSLLHIAPKHNTDFQKITSQLLTPFGSTVTQVWSNLMRDKTRFQSISTEELFSQFPSAQFPELQRWWRYIVERYSWVND